MKKRLWLLYGGVFIVFCGLLFRVFSLSDQQLVKAADRQSKVTVNVGSVRGTFYDRNKTPLVNSTTVYRAAVTANPKALTALSQVLDSTAFSAMSRILQDGRPAVVTLSRPVAAPEGISLFQVPLRYTERVLAPHVLGYADADLSKGLTGLESALDTFLSQYGGKAKVTYTVGATGKPLEGVAPTVENTLSCARGGVVLTLDANIQQITEDIAAKYIKKGAVIVMKPQTGDILAMASLPSYHPQKVAEVLENEDAPLLNRALCNYNCGSVFKIVSAATALESGVGVDTAYTCNGSVTVGSTIFHCHNRLGHGSLKMDDAFAKSCNSYFIQLMGGVGGDALWQMASRLQFNSAISLYSGYSTATAIFPQAELLQAPAVLANASFGQGELTASPLHIAQLVSTVVNGGTLIPPHIVMGYMDENGAYTEETRAEQHQRVFSVETATTLRMMMEKVLADEGTGKSGKPLIGGAGAKTGTAETGWSRTDDEKYAVVQSWYAGYYPASDPRYVIVVMAENAQNTGAKTAPVFKEIADMLYRMEL